MFCQMACFCESVIQKTHQPSRSNNAEVAHTIRKGMLMRWNSCSPCGTLASRSAMRLVSEPRTQSKPPTLTPAANAGRSCT